MTNFCKSHKYKTSCKYIQCFSSCYTDSKKNRSRQTWGECNGAFLQISLETCQKIAICKDGLNKFCESIIVITNRFFTGMGENGDKSVKFLYFVAFSHAQITKL